MAALSCKCGKLLPCARGKLSYLSKYVISLGCTEVRQRSPMCQNRFYAANKLEVNTRQRTRGKRDRLTVLKALSSTVQHVPNRPDYRFIDDLVLNPRSLIKQKELLLALDSGTKTAEYVLEKYPHLFPLRTPVPAWPQQETIMANMEVSIENLKLLMKSGDNISKVVDWYKELNSQGDISLDVQNDMLDFVSFHAIPAETEHVVEEVDEKENKSKTKWRENMFAEKLFADIKETGNSRTFEVFLLGLLKHGEIFKAFKVYQELTEKNLCGSLYMYNTLLSHVCEAAESDKERWDLAQDIVNGMQKNNIKPDVVTFNALMAVAVEKVDEPGMLCQQLLREMKKMKIAPSLGSYYYILLADRKKEAQDINILRATVKDLNNGVVEYVLQHPSDLMFFHSAMDLARFKRNTALAKELLSIVLGNGLKHLLGIRSSSFFGNYLCAIARTANDVDYLFEEYHKLVPKFFVPRDWVIQQLFFAMRNNKDPKHVPALYSDMVSMRIPFTERGVLSMFSAMVSNIQKERAEEYLFVVNDAEKWMGIFQISKTKETVSVAINVLCLCGKYEEVKEKLEECMKLEIVPSVDAMDAVLELTLNDGNKEGALNTLKRMAEYKMKRTEKTERMIYDFLSDKSEKINSWFDIS